MSTALTPETTKSLEILDSRFKEFPDLPSDQFSYKLAGGYGLDNLAVGDLDIDPNTMSMTIYFADGNNRDSVGDTLDISGIKTHRHIRNSIVLVDHGKTIAFPIARAREDPKDPNTYTVHLDAVSKKAWCRAYFYQGENQCALTGSCEPGTHSKLCEEIFDMCYQGFISGGSIGYAVIHATSLPPDYQTGTPQGLALHSTLLLEVSLVVLPANELTTGKSSDAKSLHIRDHLSKILTGGKINGHQPSDYFKKAFTPYVFPKKAQVIGGYRKDLDVPQLLHRVGEALSRHTDPAPMPGYGQIFLNDSDVGGHEAEVWYVGGDGDEDGFSDVVQQKIQEAYPGCNRIHYEAESFPPKSEIGWNQVYPEHKPWTDGKVISTKPQSKDYSQRVPNYRKADDPEESCDTCGAYISHGGQFGHCNMFDVLVDPEAVCDRWFSKNGEKSMRHGPNCKCAKCQMQYGKKDHHCGCKSCTEGKSCSCGVKTKAAGQGESSGSQSGGSSQSSNKPQSSQPQSQSSKPSTTPQQPQGGTTPDWVQSQQQAEQRARQQPQQHGTTPDWVQSQLQVEQREQENRQREQAHQSYMEKVNSPESRRHYLRALRDSGPIEVAQHYMRMLKGVWENKPDVRSDPDWPSAIINHLVNEYTDAFGDTEASNALRSSLEHRIRELQSERKSLSTKQTRTKAEGSTPPDSQRRSAQIQQPTARRSATIHPADAAAYAQAAGTSPQQQGVGKPPGRRSARIDLSPPPEKDLRVGAKDETDSSKPSKESVASKKPTKQDRAGQTRVGPFNVGYHGNPEKRDYPSQVSETPPPEVFPTSHSEKPLSPEEYEAHFSEAFPGDVSRWFPSEEHSTSDEERAQSLGISPDLLDQWDEFIGHISPEGLEEGSYATPEEVERADSIGILPSELVAFDTFTRKVDDVGLDTAAEFDDLPKEVKTDLFSWYTDHVENDPDGVVLRNTISRLSQRYSKSLDRYYLIKARESRESQKKPKKEEKPWPQSGTEPVESQRLLHSSSKYPRPYDQPQAQVEGTPVESQRLLHSSGKYPRPYDKPSQARIAASPPGEFPHSYVEEDQPDFPHKVSAHGGEVSTEERGIPSPPSPKTPQSSKAEVVQFHGRLGEMRQEIQRILKYYKGNGKISYMAVQRYLNTEVAPYLSNSAIRHSLEGNAISDILGVRIRLIKPYTENTTSPKKQVNLPEIINEQVVEPLKTSVDEFGAAAEGGEQEQIGSTWKDVIGGLNRVKYLLQRMVKQGVSLSKVQGLWRSISSKLNTGVFTNGLIATALSKALGVSFLSALGLVKKAAKSQEEKTEPTKSLFHKQVKHIRHEKGRKEGHQWVLYNHDMTKVLGTHPSEEAAKKQEQAIKAHEKRLNVRTKDESESSQPSQSPKPKQPQPSKGEPKVSRRSALGRIAGTAAAGSAGLGVGAYLGERSGQRRGYQQRQQEELNQQQSARKPIREVEGEDGFNVPEENQEPDMLRRDEHPQPFEHGRKVDPKANLRQEMTQAQAEETGIQEYMQRFNLSPRNARAFYHFYDRLNPDKKEHFDQMTPEEQKWRVNNYLRAQGLLKSFSQRGYTWDSKSLKDLIDKHRVSDGRFHRSKHSIPGAIHMQLHAKDLDNLRDDAQNKGVEVHWISDDGKGYCKVKLVGMDGVLEDLAKRYAKAIRKVKNLPNQQSKATNPIGTLPQGRSRSRASIQPQNLLPGGTREEEETPDETPVMTDRGTKAMKKTVTVEHEDDGPGSDLQPSPKGSKHRQEDGGVQGEGMGEKIPGQDYTPGAEEQGSLDNYPTEGEPYGAQVLRRIHQDMAGLIHEYDEFLDQTEDDRMRGIVMKQIHHFIDSLEELEETASSHERYKDIFSKSPLEGSVNDQDKKQLAMSGQSGVGFDSDLEEEPTPDQSLEGLQTQEDPRAEPTPNEAIAGMRSPEEEDEEEMRDLYHKHIKNLRQKHTKQYTKMKEKDKETGKHGRRKNGEEKSISENKAVYLRKYLQFLGNDTSAKAKKCRSFLIKRLKTHEEGKDNETLLQGRDKEHRPHSEEERHEGIDVTPKAGKKSQPSDKFSKEKARQMLKDGTAHGHPLTEDQEHMLQAAAHRR